jgi:hypothetical protein
MGAGGINVNNSFKALISILVIILLVGIVVITGGLAYLLPVERSSEVEQRVAWEENSQDTFVGKLFTYEERFSIIYIPANPDAVLDCYVSYHFQENGNTLRSADRSLYENVSFKNPILLEFPRKKESQYELEVTIENKSEAVLHKSLMETHSG